MPKLHELLAVEKDKEGVYKKIFEEGIQTFKNKKEHFLGAHRTLRLFEDSEMDTPEEHKELVDTVMSKLRYVFKSFTSVTDVALQKERTNQEARADVVVDGTVLAKDVPATFLLGMETKLKQVRALLETVPTLQPGISWILDEEAGEDIYKTEHIEKTYKTETTTVPVVMYKHTPEHPAQVKESKETKNVGMYETTRSSSMISPAKKSELLERCDKLMSAVKRARTRANEAEIKKINIGKDVTSYLLDGKFPG